MQNVTCTLSVQFTMQNHDGAMTRAQAIEGEVRSLIARLGADVKSIKYTIRPPKPASLIDTSESDDQASEMDEE